MAAPGTIPALTPQGELDLAWLRSKAKRAFRGFSEAGEDGFEVALERGTGRWVWLYGKTREEALGKARRAIETAATEPKP
jgi:hypothetical protein